MAMGFLSMKDGHLDEIDRKILRVLASDGRVSNQKLAEQVNLSTTPCWNRVKVLEEAAIISGYAAILDQNALGLPDIVIIEVTLDHHDDEIHEDDDDFALLSPPSSDAR